MTTLFAIVHAEATHHVDQIVGGWFDSELTARGRMQARDTAEELRSRISDVPRIYSSDLKRSVQTAEPIASAFGVVPLTEPDLREVGCGIAEGKSRAWLEARIVLPPAGANRLDHRICDGAETRREAATRVYRFVETLRGGPSGPLIVVTHGFAFTFLVSAWVGVPIESVGSVRFVAEAGSISTLEFDPQWGEHRVVRLNELTHMRA